MLQDTRKHLLRFRFKDWTARFFSEFLNFSWHGGWRGSVGCYVFVVISIVSSPLSLGFQDDFELPLCDVPKLGSTDELNEKSDDNSTDQKAGVDTIRDQKSQLRELVREYSKARKNPAQQDRLVDQILEFGVLGAEQFRDTINKRVQLEMKKYGKEFNTSLTKLNKAKLKEINLAEVASLQQRFWEVSDRENLSKEMIQKEIDPIIQRLQEMVVIDRKSVFDSNAELLVAREQLQVPGKHWERCATILHEDFISNINDPESRQELLPPSFEQWLVDEEEFLLRLAMPMGTANRAVLTTNENLGKQLDEEEVKAILSTNLLRLLVGRPALTIDLLLSASGRDHSSDMERLKFFSHDSPVSGKSSPWDRAKNFGTSASGENIAINGGGGAGAVRAWYYSPGHHKNMFGKHVRIGVGKSGRHWTQLFGK